MPDNNRLALMIVLVIHLQYACGHHPQVNTAYIEKNVKTISINTMAPRSMDLDQLFEIKKLIRLATNDSIIIGRIDKISCSQNKLYVLDGKTNYIDVFDTSGQFLFKIGAIGKGNNEYFRIADFEIDTTSRLIYLLDDFSRKMILFSASDGHPLRERRLFNFTVNKFMLKNEGPEQHLVYSRGGTAESADMWYNMLIADSANDVLSTFLPYQSTATFVMSPEHPLQTTGNTISYLPPFSTTIFELNELDTLSPAYRLHFTGASDDYKKMQDELRANQLRTVGDFLHYLNKNNYIQFLNYLETDSLLYIYFTTARQGHEFLLFRKATDTGLLVSTIRNNFLNFSGQPVATLRDQFVDILQPDSFLDKLKLRPLLPPQYQSLLDNFSSKDNPILVMLKVKNF
jgi:hypothetical protein